MTYRVLPEAEIDLREAVEWYEDRESGLGRDLRDATYEAIEKICHSPQSHAIYEGRYRYRSTRRFPFAVIFSLDRDDEVVIVAIKHFSRDEDYWRNRLGNAN